MAVTDTPSPQEDQKPRASRRNVLLGAGGAVVIAAAAGGAGYAIANTDGEKSAAVPAEPAAQAGPPKYRSRPDLRTLPDVTITTPANATAPGYLFFTPASGAGLWGPLIVDDQGSPVWFKKTPEPATVAIDFKVQQYQNKPVLTWWEGTIGGTGGQGVGQGEFVITDQSYREVTRVRAASTDQADQHDFVITPNDTALFWVYEGVPYDLTAVGGPADGVLFDGVIQEIDIATGKKLFEWRAKDHVSVADSYAPLPEGASAHLPYDWFHANSVGLAADGNIIISSRHLWTTFKINRKSGAIMWRMGGKHSDITLDDKAKFAWQHDFRQRRDGSYSVFDNGAGVTKVHPQSRGLVLKVDEVAKTGAFVKEFLHPQALSAPTQGDFRELVDGGSLIGWGQMPYFTEYAPDGTVRLDGHIPLDNQSYRAYKAEWAGTPLDQPAIALQSQGANVVVSVSWNGATKVTKWRIHSGNQPGVLTQSVDTPRSGFETTITISGSPQYVVAEALDSTGKVLGTSSAIPVKL